MSTAVVVIPTYNERENIGALVDRLDSARGSLKPVDLQVLFVDDSSPDGTASEVRRLMATFEFVHLLERQGKLGLGTAYRDGLQSSMRQFGPDILVQMDSDLQHPPEKVPELVSAVMGGADLALASRYVPGGGVKGWSRRRRLVSGGANFLARTILGLKAHDVTSGFKAFSKRGAQALLEAKLSASGFSYQVETVKVMKDRGLALVEVPFVFEQRLSGSSKLSSREILGFLKTVARLRFTKL